MSIQQIGMISINQIELYLVFYNILQIRFGMDRHTEQTYFNKCPRPASQERM
jgi:hypothetical protein